MTTTTGGSLSSKTISTDTVTLVTLGERATTSVTSDPSHRLDHGSILSPAFGRYRWRVAHETSTQYFRRRRPIFNHPLFSALHMATTLASIPNCVPRLHDFISGSALRPPSLSLHPPGSLKMARGRRTPETRQTLLKAGVCQDLADHFSSGLVQDQQVNLAILAWVTNHQ